MGVGTGRPISILESAFTCGANIVFSLYRWAEWHGDRDWVMVRRVRVPYRQRPPHGGMYPHCFVMLGCGLFRSVYLGRVRRLDSLPVRLNCKRLSITPGPNFTLQVQVITKVYHGRIQIVDLAFVVAGKPKRTVCCGLTHIVGNACSTLRGRTHADADAHSSVLTPFANKMHAGLWWGA